MEPPRPVSVLTPPVSPLRPSPCSSREALRYSVAGSDEQTDSVILLLDPSPFVVLSFLSRVNLFSAVVSECIGGDWFRQGSALTPTR
ncbi:BnaUnng04610D [Brassica napus]|uniref:BnaUnng04610D protein n=1 Tax=Brassica napus TaxID=3708 RepID=A0A078K1M5_BRANA|nr:BnaUnng04610D [Brassica napus]